MWVVIPYLVLLFSKDISCYLVWRLKYKKQGIEYRYYPIEGQMAVVGEYDNFNGMSKYRKIFQEYEKKKTSSPLLDGKPDLSNECFMTNNIYTAQPAILIFGKNLLKEYLLREGDFVTRKDPN
jgi:hypothetical protein